MATKADLQALEQATKADLQALEQATKADLQALEQATRADLAAVHEVMATKADLRESELRMTIRLGGIVAIAAALVIAIQGFLLALIQGAFA
ncbi:MAG: hypothetical protein F4X83_07515 [Chloroflexi bacterium]|nr:hypothetical protein [Chloroflexota bacterium]